VGTKAKRLDGFDLIARAVADVMRIPLGIIADALLGLRTPILAPRPAPVRRRRRAAAKPVKKVPEPKVTQPPGMSTQVWTKIRLAETLRANGLKNKEIAKQMGLRVGRVSQLLNRDE
jgi:hypothetical protein